MTALVAFLASLPLPSLLAGFALGIVFGGRVRSLLAVGLEKLAAFVR